MEHPAPDEGTPLFSLAVTDLADHRDLPRRGLIYDALVVGERELLGVAEEGAFRRISGRLIPVWLRKSVGRGCAPDYFDDENVENLILFGKKDTPVAKLETPYVFYSLKLTDITAGRMLNELV